MIFVVKYHRALNNDKGQKVTIALIYANHFVTPSNENDKITHVQPTQPYTIMRSALSFLAVLFLFQPP
jgi:hypothetical protein